MNKNTSIYKSDSAEDRTKYKLLFKITAEPCGTILKYYVGSAQSYSNSVADITAYNIFLLSFYHNDIFTLEDWRFMYGNTIIANNPNDVPTLFVGKYKEEYYICSSFITPFYIELSANGLSYTNNLNLQYVNTDVDMTEVEIISSLSYQNVYRHINPNYYRFSIVNRTELVNGDTQYGFGWNIVFDTEYKYIKFRVDVSDIGYMTSLKDSDGTNVNTTNAGSNYMSLDGYKSPFTATFYVSADRKANKTPGVYYFTVTVADNPIDDENSHQYTLPIRVNAIISNMSDSIIDLESENYSKFIYRKVIDGKVVRNVPAIIYDGKLLNYAGYTLGESYGGTSNRPNNLTTNDIGYNYYDTTLRKSIYWNGTKWVDSEGNDADSTPITSGTFANKPTGVDVGYAYFCTDKQTTEGSTNGIMIYYKGSNTWVDALGRVVS